MSSLNIKLKERRNALHLTLLQIANKLNVTEATVQRYESGEIKNIKYETIIKLSEILHCTPSYLLGWDDNKNLINCNNSIIANGNHSTTISVKNLDFTPQENELLRIYKNLTVKNQIKLLSFAFELENKD